MFRPAQKRRIVTEIRAQMTCSYRGSSLEAACLYWAACTRAHISRNYKTRTILQAGTMQWPCTDKDDGVSFTHFSYMWNPTTAEMRRVMISAGLMPEMHVWAAIPSRNEIVDLTTSYLVEQAKKRAGIE